jgi:glycerophosphoryl diester phosphodiesterase
MVFHDDHLMRLTGEDGAVRERTAEELGRLVLRAATRACRPSRRCWSWWAGRVPLLVEVKDQTHVLGPVEAVLEEAAARALAAYRGPVALMSFNPSRSWRCGTSRRTCRGAS